MNSTDRHQDRADTAAPVGGEGTTTDVRRRARRERYVELGVLVAGVLLASLTGGALQWLGLALGAVAAVGFVYSTFRDRRVGPLEPCESPKTPAALALLLGALSLLQDSPQQWVSLAFAGALALVAVQAAVRSTQLQKVLDVAIVAAITAGLVAVGVFL